MSNMDVGGDRSGERETGAQVGDERAATASVIKFSLDDVPERDRAAMMFDYFGRNMRRIQVEVTDREAPLQCDAEVRIIPGVSWGVAQMSHVSAHRTGSLLDDGCDDVMLFAPSSGVTVFQPSGGATLEVEPGGVLLMSQARAAITNYHGPAETFAFRFARSQLTEFIPNLSEAPCAVMHGDELGLGLLFAYGRLLHRDPISHPALQAEIARHLQQLAALAIGVTADALEYIHDTGVAAARLAAIKADIRDSIGRRDVSAHSVAKRHSITPRYLHMLFEREEKTFSEFVATERLAKAQRLLSDPRRRMQRISDIAFAVGFADLSTFNRQFKRQYGMTPSEAREAASKEP